MRASGVELAQSIKRLEALVELLKARGGAASAAYRSTFVWQPGGTANPAAGVYTTLATLDAALTLAIGPKTVGVDTTHGTATIDATGMPVAGWNFDDATFGPAIATITPVITIAVGAKISATTANLSFRGCVVLNNATATVWTPGSSGAFLRLNTTALESTAAGAFLDVAGQTAVTVEDNSIVGDGTHAVFKVESTGTLAISLLTASQVRENAIAQGTAPGGTVRTILDGSSFMGQTQGAGPVYAQILADPTPTFILKPGATGSQNANVAPTWALLYEMLSQQPHAPRAVLIDDNAAAAHMTAGGPYELDNVTFTVNFGSSGAGILIIDNGATISADTHTITIADGLIVQGAAAVAATVWAPAGGGLFTQLLFRNAGALQNLSATPLIHVTAANFAVDAQQTILGDGTHPVITVDVGITTSGVLTDSNIAAHAYAGAGTLNAFCDPASLVITPQDITAVVVGKTGLTGMLTRTTVPRTANYTLTSGATGGTPDYTVWADTNAGAFSVTLPTPTAGLQFVIVDSGNHSGTNAITLARHAGEKINGAAANLALGTNGAAWFITTNGTDWWVNKMVIGP